MLKVNNSLWSTRTIEFLVQDPNNYDIQHNVNHEEENAEAEYSVDL